MLKPKLRIIFALVLMFLTGIVTGAGFLSADENGWTNLTVTLILFAVAAIVLSCYYVYTVFDGIIIGDKFKL